MPEKKYADFIKMKSAEGVENANFNGGRSGRGTCNYPSKLVMNTGIYECKLRA